MSAKLLFCTTSVTLPGTALSTSYALLLRHATAGTVASTTSRAIDRVTRMRASERMAPFAHAGELGQQRAHVGCQRDTIAQRDARGIARGVSAAASRRHARNFHARRSY